MSLLIAKKITNRRKKIRIYQEDYFSLTQQARDEGKDFESAS